MRLRGRTLGNLVKLAAFFVVTLFVTTILAFTIANGGIGGNFTSYHADFSDVTSLIPGDDVRIAGVRVGQVQDIKAVVYRGADGTLHQYARVTFTVQSGVPVYSTVHAVVRYLNLVGQRYVELDETPGAATKLRGGQTIPLAQTSPALNLTILFNGFRPLFQALNPADVNALSYEIIKTLQGEGGTIDALLANTASLTNTIADRDAVIGAVVNNLDGVLRTVDANDQGLDEFIVQIQRLVTGLAADRSTIAASLGNISNLALSSAQLIASIRPSLPGDLMGLDGLAAALATTTNPNGQNTLDAVLHTLPPKLNTIIRTATYGSWFNFYLCDADMATVGPNSTLVRTGPRIHAMAAACGPGD